MLSLCRSQAVLAQPPGAGWRGSLSLCAADLSQLESECRLEKALRHLAEAEKNLHECTLCLHGSAGCDSFRGAAEHHRSIGDAKKALSALREQLTQLHKEVSGHLQEAQLRFLQTKLLISLATGYTGYRENSGRQELDLRHWYRTYGANNVNWEDGAGDADLTQTMLGASSSYSQHVDGHLSADNLEYFDESKSAGKFFSGVGSARR